MGRMVLLGCSIVVVAIVAGFLWEIRESRRVVDERPATYSAAHVKLVFAQAGVPLSRFPLRASDVVVNPSGEPLPKAIFDPRKGSGVSGFVVYVEPSVADATSVITQHPKKVDPVFRRPWKLFAHGNVVVIVEPRDMSLERRLAQVLSKL